MEKCGDCTQGLKDNDVCATCNGTCLLPDNDTTMPDETVETPVEEAPEAQSPVETAPEEGNE